MQMMDDVSVRECGEYDPLYIDFAAPRSAHDRPLSSIWWLPQGRCRVEDRQLLHDAIPDLRRRIAMFARALRRGHG